VNKEKYLALGGIDATVLKALAGSDQKERLAF
jgi:hypothetical protein